MGFLLNRFTENVDRSYDGKAGKLYKIISTISIIGVFLAAGLIVIEITGLIPPSLNMIGFFGTIFIICFALSSCLYWIRMIEKNEFKKTAIVFVILIGICALLWVICLWVVVWLIHSLAGEGVSGIGALRFIKYTVIISLQFMVASFVGIGITKYRKTMIPFQVIAYLSYLFFDFYITYFLACIYINSESTLVIHEAAKLLITNGMLTFFIISIVYVAISNSIIKSMERRRLRRTLTLGFGDQEEEKVQKTDEKTPTEKLERLKELLDKNLITQEEYDKKREEILKDI